MGGEVDELKFQPVEDIDSCGDHKSNGSEEEEDRGSVESGSDNDDDDDGGSDSNADADSDSDSYTGSDSGSGSDSDSDSDLDLDSGDDDESDEDDESSDASSQLSDDEGYDYLDPYDEANLPEYACRYCGVHAPASVATCVDTGKWLCNAPCSFGGGSHLVNHLVRSRSNQVQLHPESPLGDTILECYNCASKNAFVLGFVPASSSSVVVLLCRVCVETVPALKDMDWELAQWHPLVQDRKFLPWLVKVSDKDVRKCSQSGSVDCMYTMCMHYMRITALCVPTAALSRMVANFLIHLFHLTPPQYSMVPIAQIV